MLADWVEVVEVEAVIGGVLRGRIVYRHAAEPADRMLCLALCEECCFVFLELAAGLARSSWHTITALWCFGLESNQRFVWDALSLITGIPRIMKPWPVCSVLWYLCYPSCSATELPKLDMKNGPTIFWLNHSTNIRQYSISTVTVK